MSVNEFPVIPLNEAAKDTKRVRSRFPDGLNARHHQMLRMAQWGMKTQEIADALGVAHGTVSTVMQSPLFKAELARMQTEANEHNYNALGELKKLQEDAVLALADTVQQKEYPSLRFHAARDILNRTGANVPKQIIVDKQSLSYEEHLHRVRLKYDPEFAAQYESPIEVISGDALSQDDDEDDD